MILDTLDYAHRYEALQPGFDAAFAFLRRPDLAALADGRVAIDGDRVYAMLQTYDTKPWAGGLLEAHHRYIDIQCLLAGEEWIGYAPLAGQTVREAYREDKDIAFLDGASEPLRLRPGLFAVFFPHDAHMPGRTSGAPARVRKVVGKVAVAGTYCP